VRAAALGRRAADERFQVSLVAAIAAGASLRAVGDAAGLTHGRVSQLVGPVDVARSAAPARVVARRSKAPTSDSEGRAPPC
jgi:hypothetical protein